MASHLYGDPGAASSDSPADDDKKKEAPLICDDCEDAPPIQYCAECDMNYCVECLANHAKKKRTRNHPVVPLAPPAPLCDDCEDAPSIQYCAECAMHYCVECVASHAKKKRTKGHATVPVAGAKGGGGVLGIAVEGKDEGAGGNGGGGVGGAEDAQEGENDDDAAYDQMEDDPDAEAKVAIRAAFEAGEELEVKLAADNGGNPPVWSEIEGADVPVNKVG